jgi:cytidylate kinase
MPGQPTERYTTVTISRQMGCLGHETAQVVGEMLGYQVFWREIINEAAQRAGAPEAALAAIDELSLLGFCPSPKACQAYRQAVEQVMLELANQGDAVIIGRAGQVILSGLPSVYHVRLFASVDVRARRIAERQNISLQAAGAQVQASDRFRKNYVKRFYNVYWDVPALYDMVLNTTRLDSHGAAQIIFQAVNTRSTTSVEIETSK